ncbi:MAG: YeeE/YedE thiosulfate transporter family protein [Chryseolinea sp.]
MELLYKPWPWYIAGAVIGLTVPALLLLGNKRLGISSTLRQICAACVPANIQFFKYDWKKDSWNLFLAAGILIGGYMGGVVFRNPEHVALSPDTVNLLRHEGITSFQGLIPQEIFNWESLSTLKGFIIIILGGFMVGFGTRYARGCTSGHGIMGLSSLQWTSLVATASFFAGGILVSQFILPYLLSL